MREALAASTARRRANRPPEGSLVRRGLFARRRSADRRQWRDRRREPGRRGQAGCSGPVRREGDGGVSARIWPLTPMPRLAGDFIFLRETGDGDYSHWLIDLLPRIAVAAQFCDLSRFKIAVSRSSAAMAPIIRDSLGLFGIRPEQIVPIGARRPFSSGWSIRCRSRTGPAPNRRARSRCWSSCPRVLPPLRRRRSGFMSAARWPMTRRSARARCGRSASRRSIPRG